jgi:GDPmannose 4,6-dehydratase
MYKALITGITGQDGSYLSEHLLSLGYEVHGIVRRSSVFTTSRIDHLLNLKNFYLHHGDINDSSNIGSLIRAIKPDEVYHLAAQSHVGVSFEVPEYTGDVTGLGTLRLLNAIKNENLDIRMYNASTSEMFGGFESTQPQNEKTTFHPRSPYGTAKLYAHWIVVNYRSAFGLHASNGIMFNHESPRRGSTFVTKKISEGVAKYLKFAAPLNLGNLDAVRDWGYAKEYVEMMHLMLQQKEPDDYVIATGRGHSVREFATEAFSVAGVTVEWINAGINEKGIDSRNGKVCIEIDKKYFRPLEVDFLIGDAMKAQKNLGWQPKTDFYQLVKLMVESEL